MIVLGLVAFTGLVAQALSVVLMARYGSGSEVRPGM
jgi:hypothetical protein